MRCSRKHMTICFKNNKIIIKSFANQVHPTFKDSYGNAWKLPRLEEYEIADGFSFFLLEKFFEIQIIKDDLEELIRRQKRTSRKLRKKLLRREKRRKNACMITRETNSCQIIKTKKSKDVIELKRK